ncbi:MAG: hypothetical protein WKF93_08915 [Acidimicrobiales bacterium]
MQLIERLGPISAVVEEAVAGLVERDATARLWASDHTLWADDPTEVADRLGWTTVWQAARDQVPDLLEAADAATADGLERVVVAGMGGSSLFPEVLARTFGSRPDRLDLQVLDSTDPAAIRRTGEAWPLEQTLFVAASKSGSTIETRSHLERFWSFLPDGRHFAAVTDPGSGLAALGAERGFRSVFENRSDIGGRYSALSLFGLVPGAYAGVPLDGLLDGAAAVAAACDGPGGLPAGDGAAGPAVRLAAVLGGGARSGRDKLTFAIDPRYAAFGDWVEQLIAESTGKHGTGVLPVVGETLGPPEVYGDDRVFVAVGDVTDADRLALDALSEAGHPVVEVPSQLGGGADDSAIDRNDIAVELGAQVLLWELATALCGAVLGINPFDQPDVAAAKAATQRVLDTGALPIVALEPLEPVLAQVRPGDYLAVHAYVDPGGDDAARLADVRTALRDRLRVATTVGIGPRFLHSTGQFHKGGPPTGVFVQVVGADPDDVAIPGAPFGFSMLKQAQAAGDLATLRERGLRAARVSIDELLGVVAP